MTAPGVLLQTLALLALTSALASVLARGLLGLIPRSRLRPAAQADLALATLALPAAAMGSVALAVLLPGGLHLLGLRPDHCGAHDHHAHLCLAHPSAPSWLLAAMGAAGLAAFLGRALRWAALRARAWRDLRRLLRHAVPRADAPEVLRVPSAVALCHTSGVIRGRVLVSDGVERALPPRLLSAALEHERAHIRRRDVLAADLLAILSLSVWPPIGREATRIWSEAAEEAADAEAAARVGGLDVAEALVAVARLRPLPLTATLGSVSPRLRQRVERLIAGHAAPRPARVLPIVAGLGFAVLLVSGLSAEPLHHLAETLLHRVLAR